MINKANVFSNFYELSDNVRKKIEEELEKHNIKISYNHDIDANFNIVIGGDGTFIKAVHDSNFSQIPFVGINTGHLGFYNDIKPEELDHALDKLLNHDYIINKLRVIDCIVHTSTETYEYKAINEIVLKSKYTSIVNFDLFVDDVKLQSFAGDGIIFSTPSGSTAYSLSAGGAIVYQNIDAFQITPLSAIRSKLHRSLDKSVIVPKDTKIRLSLKNSDKLNYVFGVDGLHKEHGKIEFIDIKLATNTINKLVFNKNWFWIGIRDKFI